MRDTTIRAGELGQPVREEPLQVPAPLREPGRPERVPEPQRQPERTPA